MHITLSPSSVRYPQTNGQVESANNNILKSLKKRLNDSKGLWVEELPSTLWTIRIIVHSETSDTLFNLKFGSDAIIPVEIGINSLRVAHFDPEQNEPNLRANLDLLEEVRKKASVKAATR